jgi:catecholate siderophore receptor
MPLGAALLMGTLAAASSHAQQVAPQTMPGVVVTGEGPRDGVLARTTRVGRTVQDPHDVPQAVTTITQKLMEEQQTGALKDAMRNVAGLTFNAAEGGRSGDNMSLRGFYTFGDMYLDGIRDTAQYNRETFNLEQIDVLRGAGAMLFGRGQAGGVINQVSKTPGRRDLDVFGASLGTNGNREVRADVNRRLTQRESIRVNLMDRDEGSWRSNPIDGAEPELRRQGLGLSVGLNLYTDNQFWINQYTLRTRDNPDYGVAFDAATRRPGTFNRRSTTATRTSPRWSTSTASARRPRCERRRATRTTSAPTGRRHPTSRRRPTQRPASAGTRRAAAGTRPLRCSPTSPHASPWPA